MVFRPPGWVKAPTRPRGASGTASHKVRHNPGDLGNLSAARRWISGRGWATLGKSQQVADSSHYQGKFFPSPSAWAIVPPARPDASKRALGTGIPRAFGFLRDKAKPSRPDRLVRRLCGSRVPSLNLSREGGDWGDQDGSCKSVAGGWK